MTNELRLVKDPEERRHGTLDPATRRFERGSPRLVDRNPYLSPIRERAKEPRYRCVGLPSVV